MARKRFQHGGARQHIAPTDRYFTTRHALAANFQHSVIPHPFFTALFTTRNVCSVKGSGYGC